MRLAVFCSGFGSNFQAIIDAVRARRLRAEIVLMVCDNARAYALKRARRHGVPVCLISPRLFKTKEAYEAVVQSVLKSQAVDLIVLAGFMRILGPGFVRRNRGRILNVHPSYLPAFKGAHAIRDAYEARVKTTGVTVHLVTSKVDAGPVLLQRKVKILKNDTLAKLEKRIHQVEHRIYPLAIKRYMEKLRKGRHGKN